MKQFVKTVKAELDEDEKRLFQELKEDEKTLNDEISVFNAEISGQKPDTVTSTILKEILEKTRIFKERENINTSKSKAWWNLVKDTHHVNDYDTILHTDGFAIYIYEVADPAAEVMERLTGKKGEVPEPIPPPAPNMFPLPDDLQQMSEKIV